eukprot:768670-Hanusia_phi.AAC.4
MFEGLYCDAVWRLLENTDTDVSPHVIGIDALVVCFHAAPVIADSIRSVAALSFRRRLHELRTSTYQ